MAKTKHSFIDDNPYLVGTDAANVNVYADKPDVAIGDVFGDIVDVNLVNATPAVGEDFESAGGINGIIVGGKPVMLVSFDGATPSIATGAKGLVFVMEGAELGDFSAYLVKADLDSKYTAVDEIDVDFKLEETDLGIVLTFKAPAADTENSEFLVIAYTGE